MSLLPNHKSKFDKSLDELFGVRFEGLNLGVINILADSANKKLLGILAKSFDVDINGLGENETRAMIKDAFLIHRLSGTAYAVKKAVRVIDPDAIIIEGNLSQKYNASLRYDGTRYYGSNNHWAEYSILTSVRTDSTKAAYIKKVANQIAPVRCVLVAIEARGEPVRYDGSIRYDKNFNHGVY